MRVRSLGAFPGHAADAGLRRFSDEQLRILDGIGAFASHAVGIARTRELTAAHLESVEQMLRISARLKAADSLDSVLNRAVRSAD